MDQNEIFSILDTVESTNNYAMQQVHAGLAKHGQAWYAHEQWAGKGQRGKLWKTTVGENVILSIAIQPNPIFNAKPFLLSALVAVVCRDCFEEIAGIDTKIKWPNDIYWRDRKAGGILIENIFKGKDWKWAIIGIGINVNQMVFDENVLNATSLKMITKKGNDPVLLAREIHRIVLEKLIQINARNVDVYLENLNSHLYKKNETVHLKKGNAVFTTKIIAVNDYGQLLTKDVMERTFEVGEVEFLK